jgi:hypothetical protein
MRFGVETLLNRVRPDDRSGRCFEAMRNNLYAMATSGTALVDGVIEMGR